MARTQYFDYESPDSTALLNNWMRGILPAGVYLGFNAGQGSTGMYVSLTNDADPDNTGSYLGKLITRDGVVIEESSQTLEDVALLSNADPSDSRIDYLVATYVYNKLLTPSQSPNQVAYQILTGTPGDPPTRPTLNDNQVLICEILVPAGASIAAQCTFTNVTKKSTDVVDGHVSAKDMVRPGVLNGFICSQYTTATMTLGGGQLLTKEGVFVNDPNGVNIVLTDVVSGSNHRYDLIVAARRADATNPIPDYFAVPGTEGTNPSVPTEADAVTYITGQGYTQYDSTNYITSLCIVRVTGSGSGMTKEFNHPRRLLNNLTLQVSAGKISPLTGYTQNTISTFPFVGYAGLQAALTVLQTMADYYSQAVDTSILNDQPLKLLLDGEIRVPDGKVISIPSYVELCGIGGAILSSECTSVKHFLNVGGWSAPVTTANIINLAAQSVTQSSLPAGSWQRIEINLASDVGDYGSITPEDLRFSESLANANNNQGDPITIVYAGASYTGYIESKTTTTIANTAYTYRCIVPSGLSSRSPIYVRIGKRRTGVKNVKLRKIGSLSGTTCAANLRSMNSGVVDCLEAPHITMDGASNDCRFGKLKVTTFGIDYVGPTEGTYSTLSGYLGVGNFYDSIYVRQLVATAVQIGVPASALAIDNTEASSSFGLIDVLLTGASAFTANLLHGHIGSLHVASSASTTRPVITGKQSSVGSFSCTGFATAGYPQLCGRDFFLSSANVSTDSDTLEIVDYTTEDSYRVVVGTTNGTFLDSSDLEESTFVPDLSIVQNPWRYFKSIHEAYFEASDEEDFSNDVVVLNSGLVAFTYDASLGSITYASSVNLSSVQPGDIFVGDDATKLITIQSVNDSIDQLTVKKGFTAADFTNASPASAYVGSILRGSIRHKNTLLSTYTYNAATGVVQYANSSVDLGIVSAGMLWRDGAGTLYEISAVNAGSDNLTIVPGLTGVDLTVTDAFSGAVYANVNPRGLRLNDASPSYGVEEIHFTGELIDRQRPLSYIPYAGSGFTLHRHQVYHEFEDPRVAVIQDWVPGSAALPGAATSNPVQEVWNSTDSASATRVSITAFMTGLVFGVRGDDAGTYDTDWAGLATFKIDGVTTTLTNSQLQAASLTAASRQDIPQGLMTSPTNIIHLTPGIHTVEFASEMKLSRVFIVNQPLQDYSVMYEAPGKVWESSIPYDLPETRNLALPATSAIRGGRVLRYVPSNAPTTRAWAETSLPEISTTGTANSDTTVSGVASTAGFAVGDIILLDNSGTNNEYAIITVVGAGQFTVNSSVSFTGSTTIKLAGKIVTKQANESLGAELLNNAYEEPAESFTIADFLNKSTPGRWLDPTNGVQSGGYSNGGNTYVCGNAIVTMADGVAGNVSSEGFGFPGTGPSSMRIGFVGTGLMLNGLRRATTGTMTIRVDGATGGTVDLARFAGQLPVCSRLSYGYHTVELTLGTATQVKFAGFTTYQPKTPVIDGVPVFAMNRLAALGTYPNKPVRSSDLSGGDIRLTPIGVVNLNPATTFFPQETSTDSWQFDDTLTASESNGFNSGMNGEGSSTTKMDGFIWFYGQSLNIVWRSDSNGTAPGDNTVITVLDHDGTYRAPGSVTGDGVSTAGGLSANSFAITTAEAQRYTIKFDNVGMHCVKINGFANNLSAHLIGIEVHSPFYSLERLNDPVIGTRQKTIQTFSDLRKMRPITKLGVKKYAGSWSVLPVTLTNSSLYMYAPVTSMGGVVRVTIQGKISCSGGAPVNYTTTCLQTGESLLTLAASSSVNYLTASFLVRVPRGTWLVGFSVVPNTNRTDNVAAYGDVKIAYEEVARQDDTREPLSDEVPRAFFRR